MTCGYWEDDEEWADITKPRGDIGSISRRRKTLKDPTKVEGSAVEAVKEEKQYKKDLAALQKKLDEQTKFLNIIQPMIDHLNMLHNDAVIRMEQDTVDDVYGIKQIGDEFKKLRKELDKFLPKVEVKLDYKYSTGFDASEYTRLYNEYLQRSGRTS